ncbi:hypothetical protein GLOIN_2v1791272 [Rhizophagus irregularis DAOM 181602=DAOM 197198]|nr:hypothetical protein GLOIN_2v1791272 [Rhizophagus irregularis DAOM 181602=DAOM 197198]
MGGGKKEKRFQAEGAKAKDPSWNFYYCPYILRTGEEQVACKESGCDEMTRSRYDYCDTHAKKHRSREHYHRKKQAKMASAEIPIGNLEAL